MKNDIDLRDWFAGMAMGTLHTSFSDSYDTAKYAYKLADEMMKRSKIESIRLRQQGIADGNKK